MPQELISLESGEVAARLRSRVGALHAAIQRDDHYRDTLPAPITHAERKELEAYRRALHGRLRGIGEAVAEKETARAAISIFLGGYANVKADAKSTSHAYVAMLLEMPLSAILAALDDFKNRRVYDLNANGERVYFTLDYAPSGPRILDQAKKHIDAIAEERGRVIRLLAVDRVREAHVSDAERERVGELMRGLADRLTVGSDKIRAQERENIRAEANAARERAQRIRQEAAARDNAEIHAAG